MSTYPGYLDVGVRPLPTHTLVKMYFRLRRTSHAEEARLTNFSVLKFNVGEGCSKETPCTNRTVYELEQMIHVLSMHDLCMWYRCVRTTLL